MPKVSVLITAYNSGKYIISTLNSVLEQTFRDFEILILNNNSSDNTAEIINSFKDKRIKLYNSKENLGPYKGLNFLLKKAKGDYIAIQDHDDIWHPEKLALQIDFLEKNSKFVGCGTETVFFYESDKKYFKYFLKKENYYTLHPSLVFRNKPNLFYDEKLDYFGDAYFQKNILCKGKNLIYNIDKPLTLHLMKKGFGNYNLRRFKLRYLYIKRIFDVHGFTFYSFLIIFYEIFRKIYNFVFKNTKFYIGFDRFPYKLMGKKILKIGNCMEEKVLNMYEYLKLYK